MRLDFGSHQISKPSFAKLALLASLGARCPSIQALDCAPKCEFVCGWRELSHLRTGFLDTKSLCYLASLPSLRSLDFKIDDYDDTQSHTTPEFTSQLDEVSITAFAPLFCTRRLKNARFLSCRSVSLTISYYDTLCGQEIPVELLDVLEDMPDIPDLMVSLSECFSPTILERICVDSEDNQPIMLCFDAIAPLLSFSRLTELDFNGLHTDAIDDDALKMMAQSWPQLEKFLFGAAPTENEPDPPSLTFTGLVHLIQHCRRLRNIALYFDARPIDVKCEPFCATIPNEKVSSISIGISPITDPIAIACQLHILLPNLTSVSADYGVEQWSEVEKSLVVLTECAKMRDAMG
jgi:hypothetical protein